MIRKLHLLLTFRGGGVQGILIGGSRFNNCLGRCLRRIFREDFSFYSLLL